MTADGSFEISMGYITSPDLDNRILIISDPMLATGSPWSKQSSNCGPKATLLKSIS